MGSGSKKSSKGIIKPKKEGSPKSVMPRRSASEVRRIIYSAFDILGFVIIDDKYLFAVINYVNAKGYETLTCSLFFSTIEFIPYELRCEIYRDIAPYLKQKFIKSKSHLMPKNKNEIIDLLSFVPKTVEFL